MLDWINGTSRGRDVLQDVKNEADKHHVKERSSKKLDEGAGAVQEGLGSFREGMKTRRSGRKRAVKGN